MDENTEINSGMAARSDPYGLILIIVQKQIATLLEQHTLKDKDHERRYHLVNSAFEFL
jgi:hypothetical protein